MSDHSYRRETEPGINEPLFQEDELADRPIGAAAANPRDQITRRSPARYILTIAAVVILATLAWAFTRPDDPQAAPVAARIDSVATATEAPDTALANLLAPAGQGTPSVETPAFQPEDFAPPATSDTALVLGPEPPVQPGSYEDRPSDLSASVAPSTPYGNGTPPSDAPAQAADTTYDLPDATTAAEIERRNALNAQAEARAAAEQAAKEREERRRAEEARLRKQNVLAAENPAYRRSNSPASQAAAPGAPGEEADGALPAPAPTTSAQGAQAATSYDLALNTEVRATLLHEYRPDIEGSGRVVARLLEPLRNRRREVVFPAGTLAFGTASASQPRPGTRPRVTMSFTAYQLRDGRIVRSGPQGVAYDPDTGAMSIAARTDHRALERTARGVAAIGVDLLFSTLGSDRRSVFEQPSTADRAKESARERAQGMINGEMADETAVRSSSYLAEADEFVLLFGAP